MQFHSHWTFVYAYAVTISGVVPSLPNGANDAQLWLVYKLFSAGKLSYVEDRVFMNVTK